MFQSETLKNFLETSHTIQTQSLVLAEWNLNQPENIARIGNYRYRPNSNDTQYGVLPLTYDINDSGNYYTGATDSDVVIDGGVDDNGDPILFTTPKDKFKMIYSLEDCFKPFRPRSGINKIVYLGLSGRAYSEAQYIDAVRPESATRPRYYLSSRYDQFKYWTSYRTEANNEYGVSQPRINGRSYISDAVPFIVYNESLTSNRIVVKMQTNVGETNIGDIRVGEQTIPDPLYGTSNQTTPVRWRIQVLKNNNWVDAISFDENSTRSDGSAIIKSDGYVEISYGLNIPSEYKDTFVFAGELANVSALPTTAPLGYAYLIKENSDERGIFAIYDGNEWEYFTPTYSWTLEEQSITNQSKIVSKLVDPDYFWEQGRKIYREVDVISGIRVVVDTMNKPNCTFDLIEISPRLLADVSDRVQDFEINKQISDLGNSKIPVGSLLAGTGSVNINNNDAAFLDINEFDFTSSTGSMVAKYLNTNIKFVFYEVVKNVNLYDYYIPLKALYSQGVPQSQGNFDQIAIELRDAYYILESSQAPSLMLTDVSLSSAVMILLDNIGFSNYVFRRPQGQADPIIPYFFIAPNQNVAEVLSQLAVATQSAMFFDEYNNFVVMTKEYLLPESSARPVDTVLYGQQTDGKLPNIIGISSAQKQVNNNGQINYTQRYIQRSYGSTRQAMYSDEFKTWIYAPTLLWEITGDETTRAANEIATEQSAYSLSAMPLNSNLSDTPPTVVNNVMTNNIIDVGENIYKIARYTGYFYANGEIIKYDAVEYIISGQTEPIWINSVQEYQKYFSSLPFNGKMYPTGNIRIWSEPEYITVDGITRMKPGVAKKHGRGQFGTPITSHSAGLDPYWSNAENVFGCNQEAEFIFTTNQIVNYPLGLQKGVAGGVNNVKARESTRNGVIKNMISQKYWTEKQVNEFNTARAGTMQSSALVFTGPNFDASITPRNYVSYVTKSLNNAYRHFGTRMRIIGKIEANSNKTQTPIGSTQYITVAPTASDQQVNISGGSGGIGVMVDKNTNNGYFFEIVALTTGNVSGYYDPNKKQIVSYQIAQSGVSLSGENNRYVTITTAVDHTFSVGEKVVISGFTRNGIASVINGEWTITETTARTITYDTATIVDGAPTSGGQAEIFIETGTNINNVIFYKVVGGPEGKAYPVKLWSGLANIIVDSGRFTGQYRTVAEENPTVYDLAVEYKDSGTTRTFFLYINGKQVASVVDKDPLQANNNVALFIRGSSRCMFENIYALSENYAQNTVATAVNNISEIFGDSEINSAEALRKYAVSGFVQQSYLNGISTYQPPQFNMYYEEFGTIMRECAHFNVKYDRAYPALYARLAPNLNRIKTYSTSGFYAGSYGADFLVFNCTDKNINLDATSGNFLRINGVTFTQNTTKTLTVDDYFNRVANLSDPVFDSGNLVFSPLYQQEVYNQIKVSRQRYGVQEFSIESPYIQNDDMANNILGWIINKTMVPKKNVGVSTFGTQMIQLGDLVKINYVDDEGNELVASQDEVFVVYNIQYKKSLGQTDITLYLAEA